MKSILILGCIAGMSVSVNAIAAKKDALGQTAHIQGIYTNHTEPCRNQLRLLHDGDHEHGADGWPVKRGDDFAIEKRNGKKNYVDVKWDLFNVMQDPNMYVFNKGTATLPGDYCGGGGDISRRPYAFGIHEIGDSQHPATLHALIHLPMKTAAQTPELRADRFYLFVFWIPVDSSLCNTHESENKQNGEVDDQWRARCHALRRLVIARSTMSEDDYIQAISDEILNILPPHPKRDDRKFHNGVIHGNF